MSTAGSPQGTMSAGLRPSATVQVDAIRDYPARIDVRSPAEYADDHLPRADNHPVLGDEQRAQIGTIYAQDSPFVARRAGAALVAHNIAAMLEGPFADKPRDWAPLVYCWRGGQRSRSLVHILNEIGWRAVRLDGGYRAYRRQVIARLTTLPREFRYAVVCGLTGSGKSRLLAALARERAQVLDLEAIARHRGSLLGDLPGDPQPSQRSFESGLLDALERFDPSRTVFVESESRRIGSVQLPDAMLDSMRAADCIRVASPRALRIALLKGEYAHFVADPRALAARLERLVALHGRKTIERWIDLAVRSDWETLIGELLDAHYDPLYRRSIHDNFPRIDAALVVEPAGVDDAAFTAIARELGERAAAPSPP